MFEDEVPEGATIVGREEQETTTVEPKRKDSKEDKQRKQDALDKLKAEREDFMNNVLSQFEDNDNTSYSIIGETLGEEIETSRKCK